MKYSPSNRLLFIANSTRLASPNCYVISTITGEDNSTADGISNCLFIGSFLFNCIPTSSINSMSPKSSKRKSSSSKKHVSSDEEDNLTISDEDVEFLDQGVVKTLRNPLRVCAGSTATLLAGSSSKFHKENNELVSARNVMP